MKPLRRRNNLFASLLPALLLMAFLYNTFGYYAVYRINRASVRAEMKKTLACKEKKLLVLTIFNPARDPGFRRIHEKEFMYHGAMYDVVREETQGLTTVFYCVRDFKEEMLIAGFRKAAASRETQHLLNHLVTLALPVDPVSAWLVPDADFRYPVLRQTILLTPSDPFVPPPEKA